jgi:cell division protein FtsQ
MAVAALGACALVAIAAYARPERRGPLLESVERWVGLAGFGLDQVTLTGHRYTLDTDIFEAIDLKRAKTLLSFDSQAARSRIEELPWVEQASIERVFPGQVEVRVVERTPAAVWTRAGRVLLVDKRGHTLGPAPVDTMPNLLRIAGEGAADAVPGLLSLVQANPELQHQLALAERIGGRRWALHLERGSVIQLPARGETQALARAVFLLGVAGAQDEIDLRVAGRTILRQTKASDQTQLPRADRMIAGRL